jgi:hypothetical protein
MERCANPALVNLRRALHELRFSYHRALARKLGRRVPTDGYLWRVLAKEADEGRVISLMAAQRRSLVSWAGVSWLGMLIYHFVKRTYGGRAR